MELQAAYQLFGLEPDATPADVTSTYRGLRKPLLKELNKHNEGEEPSELVDKLESLETAFKLITASLPQPEEEDGSSTQGSGRTTGGQFVAGDVILERYEVVGRITLRPEGDTYRVVDKVRDAPIALKVLAPELLRDPKQRARLQRSLLSASLLNHPGVARVLSVLKLPQTYAVLMQIPEGSENVWDLMYGEGKGKALTRDVVLGITRQAAHALAHVHTLTPHATLRPESLWLAKDGSVKVADVGFADVQRQLRDKRQSRSKLGTAYWAPEQYRDDMAVGEPSDQYALALILYEMLSGKPSVGRTDPIRSFRKDYPQRFTNALERALNSKASRRFPSMDAFGEAALGDYTPERAAPAAVSRESLFVPALVMLAVFAGFVLSPLARGAASAIGAAVERWHAVDAGQSASDLELRQLKGMSARLQDRKDALDEASGAELERVRGLLADPAAPPSARPGIQAALTSIVRQLVGTSRRRAMDAFGARAAAVDALEVTGREKADAAAEAARAALPGLDAADPAERAQALVIHVRQHAAAAKADDLWRTQQARVLAAPAFDSAYRALLEAEAALAIGDETAAESAYGRAASAMEGVQTAVDEATAALAAFDPLARPAGIETPLEADEARALFDAWVEGASDLTKDADLRAVLTSLRADARKKAQARVLVHDDGYWLLQLEAGARSSTFAGTWTGQDAARRLRVRVAAGRAVARPREVAATLGAGRPGVRDLGAMLAAVRRDARSLWCARGPDDAALPKPAFEASALTVRSGQRAVLGRLPTAAGAEAALVEARRFEVGKQGFEASVKVSGDVLVTWLRAHAARGMRTGPGALLRVQVDGIAPRVHLIAPAKDATLEPGAEITVRLLVYDSTLTTLEVGGEAQALPRDEVYKLIEKPLRAPSRGRLTLPIRAVDAAGNETVLELGWDVR